MTWYTTSPRSSRNWHIGWLLFYVLALATMAWSAFRAPKTTVEWVSWALVSILLAGGIIMKIRGLRALAAQR